MKQIDIYSDTIEVMVMEANRKADIIADWIGINPIGELKECSFNCEYLQCMNKLDGKCTKSKQCSNTSPVNNSCLSCFESKCTKCKLGY